MTFGDNEQSSKSKVQRKNTKQKQIETVNQLLCQ